MLTVLCVHVSSQVLWTFAGEKAKRKGKGLDENGKVGEKFVSLCFGVECAHRQESVA
jgi:hypothetical protein